MDHAVSLHPSARPCAQNVTMAGSMFLFPVILPWLIGGRGPDRVALTWGLLAILALAFINTAGLLMLAFDFTSYGEQIERKEISGDR
jgi:hypothetical protein